jgi:hypothetical protein
MCAGAGDALYAFRSTIVSGHKQPRSVARKIAKIVSYDPHRYGRRSVKFGKRPT